MGVGARAPGPALALCNNTYSDRAKRPPAFFEKLILVIIIVIIIIIPTLFRLSVLPSRYLLLNHWKEFNQIWCVSCSHKWGVQLHIFWHCPLGPLRGIKRSKSIIFQFQSQFQRFFNQTVFVFSHMKDIKHIRWDFHLAALVMPQGWDLGVPWGVIFFEIQPDLVCEFLT